ncbi:hypothetical protein COLO4_05815 [Corchorus olitorius]|uniref:Uncharacterized protein n=1 Tax=Corchorus olitorius TaxID=93759 RepID=A0A1R3KPY7_9ROSI|nr:hypothetical protein COLO4_05815 [Corchorus olitorius]
MEQRQRKTQAIGDSNDPRLKEAKKVVSAKKEPELLICSLRLYELSPKG